MGDLGSMVLALTIQLQTCVDYKYIVALCFPQDYFFLRKYAGRKYLKPKSTDECGPVRTIRYQNGNK